MTYIQWDDVDPYAIFNHWEGWAWFNYALWSNFRKLSCLGLHQLRGVIPKGKFHVTNLKLKEKCIFIPQKKKKLWCTLIPKKFKLLYRLWNTCGTTCFKNKVLHYTNKKRNPLSIWRHGKKKNMSRICATTFIVWCSRFLGSSLVGGENLKKWKIGCERSCVWERWWERDDVR